MKLNKKEETYRYTFSIIIPIYNVEDYLSEAIESIINQTISFENEVQIILVNDGSLDNCDEICKKYSAMYPSNITYLHKENGGVSSARNLGIEHAEGKYLNFLDPDDILESNVLEHMKVFFSKNNDIKLAAMPLHFFGSQTGEHILNTKFDKERVVDINVNTRDFILHGPAVFIHREAIGASRFPLGKKYGEDSQFIIEIVMNLKKYGLVPEAKYYYRKRFDGTSALNNGPEDIDFYIRHLEDFIALLEKYRDDKTGIIPMYIQNFVMYDVQWRIVFKETPQVLKEYIDKYTQLLFEIVSRIDSIVINSQKNLNWYQRNALLGLKHGAKDLEYGQSSLHGDEYVFENFWGEKLGSSGKYAVTLDNFDYCDEKVNISGFIHGSYFSNDMTSAIISMSNGTEVPAETFEYRRADTYLLGQKIHEYCGFKVSIDKKLIEDSKYFSVHIKTGGFISEKATVQFRGHFVKASDQVKNAYLVADKKAISYCKKEMQFNIVPYSIKTLLKYELGNRIAFFQQKKKDANLITFTRLYARLKKKMSNRTINLFMDRADKADDNAEALYDYFVKYGDKKDKNYFILLKGSTDYSRLQKKGYNLVPYGSTKHRLLLLTADNLISSSGDQECYHPFSETNRVYNDVKSYKYAFLTHGILQGDISHWLRKSVKDFRIFVTANKEEYKTVITGNFQFTEREVKLTGLPRYDKLISADNPKNIMLMPTWRYDIVSPVDKETNLRPYNETFKESSYYKTWNSILNNERLLDCAKKAGYRIQFVPHPSIRQQLKDFDLANVDVVNETDLYSELFKNGSLLVTDYSSVHFDFAYMKKPVAYYHFDSGNYPYEFSYEDTGFGPVLKDEEALIDYILGGIEEKFEMGHKYIQRVDEFFVYKDKNNCERLYNEIKNLK